MKKKKNVMIKLGNMKKTIRMIGMDTREQDVTPGQKMKN